MGLDENAVETVKTWRFEPATRDGQPTTARISVEVSFKNYDPPPTSSPKRRRRFWPL
jgi:hypothetical protein